MVSGINIGGLAGGLVVFVFWLAMMGGIIAGWVIFLITFWRTMKAHESIASTIKELAKNLKPQSQ